MVTGTNSFALSSLSIIIEEERSDCYKELGKTNATLEVADWIVWFSERVIEAVKRSQETVNFLIEKTKFLGGLEGQLNSR